MLRPSLRYKALGMPEFQTSLEIRCNQEFRNALAEKSRHDLAKMKPRAADSLVCLASRRPPSFTIPTDTRTSFTVFRNYRWRRHLVAFEKPFRLLEPPLPEIRFEFECYTSNADSPQSGMSRPAKCQKFRRGSKRRHRAGSRQTGNLKRRSSWPWRTSLLRSIFSEVGFVFSS